MVTKCCTKQEIIKRLRYSIMKYDYIDIYGHKGKYIFIVLKDVETDRPVRYTRFEKYLNFDKIQEKKSKTIINNAYNVCLMLNYLFIETQQIDTLADVTLDMLQDFFVHYLSERNNKGKLKRNTEDTIRGCLYDVIGFMRNYINAFSSKINFNVTVEELYYEKNIYNSKIKGYKDTVVPNILIKYPKYSPKKNRNFPRSYLNILLKVAEEFKPDMLLPIACTAYAGIREGGICNLTLGSIKVIEGFGDIAGIEIDVTDDASFEDFMTKDVGAIKKYRKQKVYTPYINEFNKIYINHLKRLEVFLKAKKRKFEIGNKNLPLFYNSYGKPLTVATYYSHFKDLFYNYFLPVLYRLAQKKDKYSAIDFVYYEQYKQEFPGAHCLRHWFTMVLVMDGLSAAEIQKWRGDSSPDSALDYIHNQGELMSKFVETTLVYQETILSEIYDKY